MHELSIAQSIVEFALEQMLERGLKSLSKIGLRVGALSGVDAEALRFGYDALTAGTTLGGSSLDIEQTPVQARCRSCRHSFSVGDWLFLCPECESPDCEVTQGQELNITYLEGE